MGPIRLQCTRSFRVQCLPQIWPRRSTEQRSSRLLQLISLGAALFQWSSGDGPCQ